MENEFVSYELALALKELGFDEPCFTYYYNITGKLRTNISIDIDDVWISGSIKKIGITLAPTFSQAFRFFREKYDFFGCIDLHVSTPLHWYVRIDEISINDYVYHSDDDSKYYVNYEDAELACLMKLIEIAENV